MRRVQNQNSGFKTQNTKREKKQKKKFETIFYSHYIVFGWIKSHSRFDALNTRFRYTTPPSGPRRSFLV